MGKKRKRKEKKEDGLSFREGLMEQLKGSKFRLLNEDLFYATTSANSVKQLEKDQSLFDKYHAGFAEQVKTWPENPVEVIFNMIWNKTKQAKSKIHVVDFGCGDAFLARSFAEKEVIKVSSFDLVAVNSFIQVANSTNVPVKKSSADYAVFSLSLMGKDFVDFLREGNRVLKSRGILIVAEVKSRFCGSGRTEEQGIKQFVDLLSKMGFGNFTIQKENNVFVLIECQKIANCPKILEKRFEFKDYKYKKR
eukprot:snap_masked-scaffold_24-processed-gene-2.49-mRNA-1 protein AED:0.01 eAED:0.01 QI:0/-1/0/1/-1/1/1/0/249